MFTRHVSSSSYDVHVSSSSYDLHLSSSYVHQINLESNEQLRLFKCREPAKVSMSGDGVLLMCCKCVANVLLMCY
jgi:hypothetical protein